MKYLWIIIIVIAVLVWTVASIIDIVDKFISYSIPGAIDELEYYSAIWFLTVIFGIFIYSYSLY